MTSFHFFEQDITKCIPADVQYRVITKTETMFEHLNICAMQEDESKDEFQHIGTLASELVEATARKEEGSKLRDRNRYQNIIPYDRNIVRLNTKTGFYIS